jgi:hypothetical protein
MASRAFDESLQVLRKQRLLRAGAAVFAVALLVGIGVDPHVASAQTSTKKKSSSKSSKSTTAGAAKSKSTKSGNTKSSKAVETSSTKEGATKSSKKSTSGETEATKPPAGASTTVDVRPVTESTTKPKAGAAAAQAGSSTTVAPAKAVKGPVFIPGAGRVLDLGANEVAKLAAGGRVEADVRGASGLAASGSGAVIVDVTITNPTTPGKVTLTPVAPEYARSVVQTAVSFQAGSTTVSRVAVPVGASGLVKVSTSAGPSGLAVAVVGWVVTAPAGTTEPSAIPMEPCRIFDTVSGLGGLQGEITPARPFDLPAVGIAKVPPALAATGPTPIAVILSVTGSKATGPLELRVVPTGSESPELKMTLAEGQSTTANFVVPVGADARAAFYVSAASTQISVDVVGWLDRDNAVKSGGPC